MASHELKNPIQPIIAYAELAKRGRVDKDEALDIIQHEAMRLRELANSILDVSKIEGGALQCTMNEVNLNEVLKKAVESARLGIKDNNNIEIELKIDQRITSIVADEARLAQVLNNLLSNALKFTREGVITVASALEFSEPSSSKIGRVKIEVTDSGPGIPTEILPKLFTKFSTKDIEGRNKNGTSLGLFITKAMVEAHGGKIHAHNKSNGGATFQIILPVMTSEIKRIENPALTPCA